MKFAVICLRWCFVSLLLFAFSSGGRAEVVISEFMAKNSSTLLDDQGLFSDWVELHNTGNEPVDLGGWHLTDKSDELSQWTFPSTNLATGGYLVVFASGTNIAVAGRPLHAPFKLDGSGEYLGLIDPNGIITSHYAPKYPEQRTDVSYGLDPQSGAPLFFSHPTPGSANDLGSAGFAEEPRFSIGSGVYTNGVLTLELSASSPTAVIRYTINGLEPTLTNAVYDGPISINVSTMVRARVFDSGFLPSPSVSRQYTLLGADVLNFDSNLPLIVINTLGKGINDLAKIPVNVRIIDTVGGRASLKGEADHDGWAGISWRGSSSLQFPKKSYSLELRDEEGADQKASPLGFPKESDWVLYAPYTDKTLMRDVLAYEMHGNMGHYSVRTRFVEVFVDASRGRLAMSDYVGIYVFEEKIKRGKDRVDVAPLTSADNQEPEITGGYIFKKDRLDPGDSGFSTARAGEFAYVEPKEQEITPAQSAWLRGWLGQFEAALYGASYRNPETGYARYIDVNSFIDQHWIVELSKNIDGFRLSNYMHKDRLGKLKMDPIWDWNLSFGNANYLNGWTTNGWYSTQVSGEQYPWFARLFQDPDFKQRYIDRWETLRQDTFITPEILGRVDELAAFLNEAQIRNYNRWKILGTAVWPNWYVGKTYQDEINWMKQWIAGRFAWIDSNYVPPPVLSHVGGKIPDGFTLSIAAPKGIVQYTLDGTDPRLSSGFVNSVALTYAEPLSIPANARVVARARVASSWSAPVSATFFKSTPPLLITEIMYHPMGDEPGSFSADDFQFVEIKNAGAEPVNLAGIHFGAGIDFTFGSGVISNLAAGERLVVVKNLEAFRARYGAAPVVAGEFSGTLSHSGERLSLEGPLGESIVGFSFENGWRPATDGHGFSLVLADENVASANLNKKTAWRASNSPGGSPGAADGPAAVPEVWVNEALTHTDLPEVDAVELFNPNNTSVDIGNWYLTDRRDTPRKYRFPSPTIVPAGGFLVVTEHEWNPEPPATNSFRLDSHGEEIFLFSGGAEGKLTGYGDGFTFGAAENGVTFGRFVTGTGGEEYPSQRVATLGAANSGPKIGPIVFNEIKYHPALGGEEFIELKNITDSAVALYDPNFPTNVWKLEGAGFRFPRNLEIPARGFLLLAGSDPAKFRAKYNIPVDVTIFALEPRVLRNSGESLKLSRPLQPDVDLVTGACVVPYVLVDEVKFRDGAPWPAAADGSGASLERIDSSAYGNDAANWRASYGTGSPGRENGLAQQTWRVNYFSAAELLDPTLSGDGADPDRDGQTNLEEFIGGTNPKNGESLVRIDSVSANGGSISLQFVGVAGRSYLIQQRSVTGGGLWSDAARVSTVAQSGPVIVLIPMIPGAPASYYQVVARWP
jgi:hypothetical protein